MDIKVRTSDLARELSILARVVSRKPTIAVLGNVLVEAEMMGDLRLAATDLDVGLRTTCRADVAAPGKLTIPALKLLEIVKSLPDAEMRIRPGKTGVEISAARFDGRLQTMAAEDYPSLPDPAGLSVVPIGRPVLRILIARVRFAVSDNQAQLFLNGARLVLPDGGISLVSTDAHRLSLASGPRVGAPETPVTIPTKALDALPELIGDADGAVDYARSEQHLFFTVGPRMLFSRMLAGEFPAYDRIIPKANALRIVVDRAAFVEALKRAQFLLFGTARSVLLKVSPGAVDLVATSAEVGDGNERIAAEYDGAALDLRYNAQYLLDFLTAIDAERVAFEVADGIKPAILRPDGPGGADATYVIMPMSI